MPRVFVNNVNIYYEVHGEGDPLVLILGLGSDISQYMWLISELAATFSVVAFDNRGAGRSDRPKERYTIEMMADDLDGLLDHLRVEHAYVVGISLGSRVAVDLAVRHPDRVRSLTLVSVLVRRIGDSRISPTLRLAFASQWLPRRTRRYRQPWYAFAQQHAAALDYDTLEQTARIHVPTAILHGRRDRTAAFRGAEELHRALSNSRLIAFEGNHLFFRSTEREQFIREIQAVQ